MNWLNIFNSVTEVAKVVAHANPIATIVISGVQAVVNKANDGIGNESVSSVVAEMAKSKWNDLDQDKLVRINNIIFEDEAKATIKG